VPSSAKPTSPESAAIHFAQTSLGPRSGEWVQGDGLAQLLAHLQQGLGPEDAVLMAVHGQLGSFAGLDEEFIGYFLGRLLQVRVVDLYPGLRRFLDTGDLVQSVLGDLWPKIRDLEFRDQASFLALLVQRLRWKAGSRRRALHAEKRKEDRRDARVPIDGVPGGQNSPVEAGIRREEVELAALAIFKLPREDQLAVRLHLAGASSTEIAQELELEVPAARKRLQRALQRLQSVMSVRE
jgi:RNA polymerase sigma factor (sigma-70 family)